MVNTRGLCLCSIRQQRIIRGKDNALFLQEVQGFSLHGQGCYTKMKKMLSVYNFGENTVLVKRKGAYDAGICDCGGIRL